MFMGGTKGKLVPRWTRQFRPEPFKGQLSLGSDEALQLEPGMGSESVQEDPEKPGFPPQLEKGTQKAAVRFASRRKRNETHRRPEKVVRLTFS